MTSKNKNLTKSIFYPTPKVAAVWFLIFAAAYGIYRFGNYMKYKTAFFPTEEIKISGVRYLDSDAIRTKAKIDTNQALFLIDLSKITAALLKDDYIRGVSVSRVLPSTILIDIQEREPVFYMIDKTIYMVDETGAVLKKLPGMPMGELPIVTGLSAGELEKDSTALARSINLVKKIREVDESMIPFISEINIRKNKSPELVLIKGAARVKLGNTDYYQRLFLLSQFLNRQPIINRLPEIKQIDLTFADRIIIQKKS